MTTKGADFNRLEELQARMDDAELVANSGRGQRKGDARRGDLLIDYKFTEKGSYSVNLKEFRKFEQQAYNDGPYWHPVVVPVFTEHDRELAIISWDDLKGLADELEAATRRADALEDKVYEMQDWMDFHECRTF